MADNVRKGLAGISSVLLVLILFVFSDEYIEYWWLLFGVLLSVECYLEYKVKDRVFQKYLAIFFAVAAVFEVFMILFY